MPVIPDPEGVIKSTPVDGLPNIQSAPARVRIRSA